MRYLDLTCRIPVAETPHEVADMLTEAMLQDKKLFKKIQKICNKQVAIQFVNAQLNELTNPPKVEQAPVMPDMADWGEPKPRRK